MIKNLFFLMVNLFLILNSLLFSSFGQQTGELIDIEYPHSISSGEKISVSMTVTNTGLGTWQNVCAFIGYVLDDLPVLTTCPDLGMLEPGDSGTYTCSTESGIPATPERLWAGLGSPFG